MNQRKNIVEFYTKKAMYQLDPPALEGSRKGETLTSDEFSEILLQLLVFISYSQRQNIFLYNPSGDA